MRCITPFISRGLMHLRLGISAALVVPVMALGLQAYGEASSPPSPGCGDPTPYRWLPTSAASQSSSVNASAAAELAQRKAALTATDPSHQKDLISATALSTGMNVKLRTIARLGPRRISTNSIDQLCGANAARGSILNQLHAHFVTTAMAADSYTSGTDNGQPFAWLNYLNQQAQQCNSTCQNTGINYFCGPATIAEETTTEGVAVSQPTAASDMGSTSGSKTTSGGTSVSAMLSEMQNKLGVPEYNQSWYLMVWVSGSPTSSEISTFESDLWTDIVYGMPVSGDAYMLSGRYRDGTAFPHLDNWPNVNAFHYFEIGGEDYGISQVYYADSVAGAGTYGIGFSPNNVQAFNWIPIYYTNGYGDPLGVVEILGGRGYMW